MSNGTQFYKKLFMKMEMARALLKRDWKLYGYRPHESDPDTDYFDAGAWSGVASHPDHPEALLVVFVDAPREFDVNSSLAVIDPTKPVVEDQYYVPPHLPTKKGSAWHIEFGNEFLGRGRLTRDCWDDGSIQDAAFNALFDRFDQMIAKHARKHGIKKAAKQIPPSKYILKVQEILDGYAWPLLGGHSNVTLSNGETADMTLWDAEYEWMLGVVIAEVFDQQALERAKKLRCIETEDGFSCEYIPAVISRIFRPEELRVINEDVAFIFALWESPDGRWLMARYMDGEWLKYQEIVNTKRK